MFYHLLTYRLVLFPLFGMALVKIDVECKKFKMYLLRELASKPKDSKNVPAKKLQIKTNPDNATENVLKYKASVNRSVMQFQMLLFFSVPCSQLCASPFPYSGIIWGAFSLGNFKPFF